MYKIINGNEIAKQILSKLKKQVMELQNNNIYPKLVCILVGEDKASLSFVQRKEADCKKIGIEFELFQFPENITCESLSEKIRTIQRNAQISGLIIQLPLPKHINKQQVLDLINPRIDVDCLTSTNFGKLATETYEILPPTLSAILHLLKVYKVKLLRKHVVVVGRGDLVGKPLAILLTHNFVTLTICSRKTQNLARYTRQADILISASGHRNLIKGGMVKKGVFLLDAGCNFYKGRIYGDCHFESVAKKASFISPVPGGIGPVTVAKLLENVIFCAKNIRKK